jgi:hypothetical protein
MQTSIRTTHEFFNSSKQISRQNNINIAKQSNLFQDEKLICSWCELMGSSGLETLSLLETNSLLLPNSFIGIDTDKSLIDNFSSKRPDLIWYNNNIFDIIPKLSNVGILNLDIYGNIDNDKDYFDLSLLKPLIANSINKFGEFILFYNKDLDGIIREKKDISISLRSHTKKICETFNGYLTNRIIDQFSILPKDYENNIENKFVGQLGAYEIYRGKKNGHRMCNLHLIFR